MSRSVDKVGKFLGAPKLPCNQNSFFTTVGRQRFKSTLKTSQAGAGLRLETMFAWSKVVALSDDPAEVHRESGLGKLLPNGGFCFNGSCVGFERERSSSKFEESMLKLLREIKIQEISSNSGCLRILIGFVLETRDVNSFGFTRSCIAVIFRVTRDTSSEYL